MEKQIYRVIGLMSGSSLDGLDIAYCIFEKVRSQWRFHISVTDCIEYPDNWKKQLVKISDVGSRELTKSDSELGEFFGIATTNFIKKNKLSGKIDFIASHGHTVFHHPELKMTCQIGNGAVLSSVCQLPVVCDFRTADIANGGQGAPIVPIGDKHLFPKFNLLLNIGGIANITIKNAAEISAFDICLANQVLNHFANQAGLPFDVDGALAKKGRIHIPLLLNLNELEFFQKPFPKSLDNSFSKEIVIPMIEKFEISIEEKLCTFVECISIQVSKSIGSFSEKEKLMITGGGALNKFLVKQIEFHSKREVIIPNLKIVEFKEAMIMAFMGVLRMREEPNCLASVTGAKRDSIGGVVFLP